MARMKAVQVSKPHGDWELVEREIPEPGPRQVRVKVQSCGVCHSDMFVKEGFWPGVQYPRVTGHEISGRIDAVGADVTNWKKGQRVGVGWHGGHCFVCDPCRRGHFILCENGKITGFTHDGGYAEYMVSPAEAIAAMPEDLPDDEAAPLLCAGITVFNALRNSIARAGDTVAVQGVGGLGHLGIQYAKQMGFDTIAIGRGKDKEELASKLGARRYIDSDSGDPADQLKKMGGARVILATAPDAKAMSALPVALKPGGELLVIGAPSEPLSINVGDLLGGKKTIQGWPSGTAKDSEDTLQFSVRSGVRPMIEKFPLEKVKEAYDRMMSGKARFRVVLTIGS